MKIAVTGMGLITPLGMGKEINWRRLIDGQSQVRYEIKHGAFTARAAGFDDIPESARQLAMAFLAANEAVSAADLGNSGYKKERIGISAGESKYNLFSRNFNVQDSLCLSLGKLLNAGGRTISVSAACATGSLSVIRGCKMIQEDICDAVICGGAETSIHPLYIAAFKNMGVLSKRGVKPFDKERDGFAIGEGAGFIIVEDMKKALLRGADIYCEIAGFSCGMFSAGAYSVNSGRNMENIIKKAAGGEIPDFIHMHGTGTKANDYYESEAVSKSFQNSDKISVCSTKAATGYMLGVSGLAGAVFSIMAINSGIAAPTLNFKETDIPFGLDYVCGESKKKRINSALSLSFGFAGQGAALYFKKAWAGGVYG